MAEDVCWNLMSVQQLAEILCRGIGKRLIIDSRSFLEFNTCHINESVNISSSKLIKRRLQQDKLPVRELLTANCQIDMDVDYELIIYDQCTTQPTLLSSDCFLVVLIEKLVQEFTHVFLLKGGFLEFQTSFPSLCESQASSTSCGNYKCPPMTSMSQPCMPVSNIGPTKILPFLFLGSQQDALCEETMKQNGIAYVLNVSTTGLHPSFIQEGHFLRIPVNDSYQDKLLPHFQAAFQFLDKVREANGCVLVHCLAGISRSPTIAIAYIMRHLNLSTDEAYKYVKDKRPTISPNFNFLGQLWEYEKHLNESSSVKHSTNNFSLEETFSMVKKRQPCIDLMSPVSPCIGRPKPNFGQKNFMPRPMSLHSPTTALSKLTFNQPSPVLEVPSPMESPSSQVSNGVIVHAQTGLDGELNFAHLPITSLHQINFTPCFAGVEADPTNNKSVILPVNNVDEASSAKVSVKRPLFGNDNMQTDGSDWCPTNENKNQIPGSESVIMRFSESRPKRPLVRPNSIAFSSFPKIDFTVKVLDNVKNNVAVSTVEQCHLNGRSCCNNTEKGREVHSLSDENETWPAANEVITENGQRPRDLCRKSRSLEDILNSPEEQECCKDSAVSGYEKPNKCGRFPNALDMLGPTVGQDPLHCRWQGMSDRRMSSGSISSGGSHASLHGSVEFIEVS